MKYTSKSLDAQTLLAYLENGAKLRTIWRGGKQLHLVRLSHGEEYCIQYSNIRALLKSGKLHSVAFSGGEYSYYLTGHSWHEAILEHD